MKHIFSISLLCLGFLLTACTSPRLEREIKDMPMGSGYKPDNIYAVDRMYPEVRRVAVLPFATKHLDTAFMSTVEDALVQSLRRQGRFEVVRISEAEVYRVTGADTLAISDPFPPHLLERLQETFQVQAVLQTEVTAFRPYKPLVLGIQSRLFLIPESTILWSCDEIFDAGNEKVVTGARQFSEKQIDQPYPLQSSYSTLISPQRFAAYVGETLYETLPPRRAPQP